MANTLRPRRGARRPWHAATGPVRTIVLLVILALALAGPRAVAATELHLLSSWPSEYLGVRKLAMRYMENVETASDGRIRFTLSGPEAIPAFEQLTPTALGIFDVLFTHGMFHFETSAMGTAVDAIRADPATVHESGVWNAVDAHYRARGLKLLAMPVMTPGYVLMLRTPLDGACDLAGRRIRAAPIHQGLVEALGGQVVELPAPAVGDALARGDIDGVAWPLLNGLDYPWYEHARALLRPSFGTVTHLVLISLATWNTLDAADRAVLSEQGVALEVRAWKKSDKYTARIEGELLAHGLQATLPCEATRERLDKTWSDGVWALGIVRGGDEIAHLRELAEAAGITP
ncbi:MAG: TRAP transporter substrate-binding protein DctP [Gammaproteobacteria bacterium]|nr:TRAP transporter substrate-binding protein DctP [Gammaproteobacteria bacterium]